MYFDLTDGLSNSIQSAMENQNTRFVIDAQTGVLAEAGNGITADEERFYALPEWDSIKGFSLREQFVSGVYDPLIREELQNVLHAGRGVFRNFKSVVKKYPEVDRKWHLFKNYQMRIYVNNWYNALRETWGLEQLGQEPEDIEDLVRKDFVFRDFSSIQDGDLVLQKANCTAEDFSADWPEEIGKAFICLWKQLYRYGNQSGSETGFTCTLPSEEFIGCITFAPCPLQSEKTVLLTSFFVVQNFRGLGIGGELLSLGLASLRDRGIRWVIIANTIIPNAIVPLLNRSGFEKLGSGFIADLLEKKDIL